MRSAHPHRVTHIARRDPGSPVGRDAIVRALDGLDAVFGDRAGNHLPVALVPLHDELAALLASTENRGA